MLRRHDPFANPEKLIQRVYSYAAYRLGAGQDAEDATSDALERALRYRDSYDPRSGSAQAWLLGIARRVVDDHLAKDHATRPDLGGVVEVPADAAGDDAIDRLNLRDGLAHLSQNERDLLALRYGADLTARDIAFVLGTRTNAVEVALHRTIAKLRSYMNSSAGEHEIHSFGRREHE